MILAALLLAAACVPLPTCSATITSNCATPTPTIKWDQPASDVPATVYRLIWRRVGDVQWRGLYDLAVFDEIVGDESEKRIPGVEMDVPLPRILPTTEQLIEVEVSIISVAANGVEAAPSPSITICMPPLCKTPGPCN